MTDDIIKMKLKETGPEQTYTKALSNINGD